MAETGEQSEDGDGEVEVESGGKGDGGHECEEFGGRNVEEVEHVGDIIAKASVQGSSRI